MARYSDTIRDEHTLAPVYGVNVFVKNQDGTPAVLMDDYGNIIDKAISDEYGSYYFNTVDGFYDLVGYYNGRTVTKTDGVQIGNGPFPQAAVSVECSAYDPTASAEGTPLGVNVYKIATEAVASLAGPAGASAGSAAAATYVQGYFGSRAANIVDITTWDRTAGPDLTAAFQALLNVSAAAGIPVQCPAGVIRLTGPVTIPFGSVFRGMGQGDYATDPTKVTTFFLDHTGKGFVWAGGLGSTPFDWEGCNTLRNQPAVVSGQPWVSNDHDFDFYLPQAFGCRLAKFVTYNPARGIYVTGGRLHLEHWGGQPFKIGLQVDWAYDTCNFDHIHLWQYWNLTAPEVFGYAYAYLKAFYLKRLDNSVFFECFSIVCQYSWYISRWTNPTNDPALPAGTCNKLKLIACDSDVGTIGIYVAPEAGTDTDGPVIILDAYTCQGLNPDQLTAQPQIFIEAPNTQMLGDVTMARAGSNAVRVSAGAVMSDIHIRLRCDGYNLVNQGFPGVEVVPKASGDTRGQAGVFLLPGSKVINGNGAPATSGNVIIWKTA